MKNFWQSLKKPFTVLAPMDDVTDTVFRRIVADCGRPDVFFTEFTNTDGLQSVGKDKVVQRLQYTEHERPLIAQIWGTNPEHYYKSAQMLVEMQFDGIDINMGCPERSIVAKGSCAALIKNPTLAKEIIHATKEGAGDLPVSVKTRIGYSKIQTEEWIGFLLEQDLPALTVHGRTQAEMSKVPAHWDEIAKVVELRNTINKNTIIIGNGDVARYQEALEKHKTYGVDGVMIGRGVFHNPWIFNPAVDPSTKSVKEKLTLLTQHITLFNDTWGKEKNFDIMKKFYKVYVSGFDNASSLRETLVEFRNAKDTLKYLQEIISTYSA